MLGTNKFVQMIQKGDKVEIVYDPFGNPNQYIFRKDNSTTCVPKGNDNFEKIALFLTKESIRPEFKISWVNIVKDSSERVLHYLTDKGPFVDLPDNQIIKQILDGISSNEIEVKENDESPLTKSIELSVFLSRKYSILDIPPDSSKSKAHKVSARKLGLPFDIDIELKEKIEPEYFDNNDFLLDFLNNTDNNLVRITVTSRNIKKVYNWAKQYLESEIDFLEKSLDVDFALFKRKRSHGPRTSWYFDWLNMQNYLWAPILYITNKIIGQMNFHAHRKGISLINKDDIGDISCLKVFLDNGQSHIQPLSTLQDNQIHIYPKEFFWDYHPTDIAFQKVKFLINQGLYFEALVVAQAILESIVNGMFPPPIIESYFGVRELRWERKYKYLRNYFNDILHENSSLRSLLNGGLTEIYKYRNQFSHDYFEHQPDYDFDIAMFQQIQTLLNPLTDVSEKQNFMSGVSQMYGKRVEFIQWLTAKNNT